MLRLRKILLCNYLYYLLLIIVLLITIIRIELPNKSIYTNKSTKVVGIITKIIYQDKTTIYLKNKENIIVTFYNLPSNIKLHLGDKVEVQGTFKEPSSNTTDYLFDYKKYLQKRNIYYLVEGNKITKLKNNKNIYYLEKQFLINKLNNNPYLYTFILGDKSYLDNNVKRSYQENGISHLFAISGMHISLLVLIISKILSKTKIQEEKLFIIITIILLVYLSLVGLSPSILRGVLFYILFSINRIKYLNIKPINIFLFILSISLLINPNYLYDIGFQYSYSISLSLLLLSNKLSSNNYFISLLKVSCISFIVSIPITLYNFYQINILSILYNLFFVPFVSIIVFPLSLIVLVIPQLEIIYNILILILENISLLINQISIGKLIFKRLPSIIYIIYSILILIYLLKQNRKVLYILLFLLCIHYLIPYFDGTDYLEILDVGQGDSILLHSNKKNILIDTGGVSSFNKSFDGNIFYNTTQPLLKSAGIKKIDYLILTHGDFDHMGEAITLVNNFKVDKVILNCGEYNDLEKKLIKVLDKKHIKYYSCIQKLNIDDNKLYFLNTKEYDNENDNSNVIYTELDNYKFLFMGDASITTEKEILNKYNLPDIDVLKVGHHGSKTSSSKEFIDEINPKYSIISVGKNNRYGHPNKEALYNLENSKIYRTDQDGSIMFKIKSNKLKIETCEP